MLVSGAFELLGAAGLLLRATRAWAAWSLFALTVAVTPANVYMLQQAQDFPALPHALLVARLPFQAALLVLIAWVATQSRGALPALTLTPVLALYLEHHRSEPTPGARANLALAQRAPPRPFGCLYWLARKLSLAFSTVSTIRRSRVAACLALPIHSRIALRVDAGKAWKFA